MSYEPKTWVTGEVIVAVDLNHIEQGIADISEKGIVESVTGDLVTGTVENPIVDLPDWVNEIKNGRFTNFRTVTGVSNLLPTDAGCLIFSGHIEGTEFNNELIFNDNALEVQERFVILNEYPMKLTNSNDTTVIAPDGYLTECSGNGEVVWVVKTDTGTFYAFGSGLKREDVNDKMVMAIGSDNTAVPMPLSIKHLTNVGGFPAFSNGLLTATAMNSSTQTGLLSFVKFNNSTAESGTFPMYGTGGVLKVANGVAEDDAVNMGQIALQKLRLGTAPDDAPWVEYPAEYVPITGNETAKVMLEKLYGIAKFFKEREDRESNIEVRAKSGQHNIPPNIDGKYIFICEADATADTTVVLPSSLNNMLGLEIIIGNQSPTFTVRFRSNTGLEQIREDIASPLIYDTTIPNGAMITYVVTEDCAVAY